MPATVSDASLPREIAERRLNVKPGTMTLDELARVCSVYEDEPLSVRDIHTKPIAHSRVYHRGEALDVAPYLARFS